MKRGMEARDFSRVRLHRYVRNQTTEAQFLTKNEWKRELAHEGRMTGEEFRWVFGEYPDTLDILPYDYYGEDADDVLDKSEGGFLWTDFRSIGLLRPL